MTSLNGYIQGLGSGADRIVRKTGTTVKLSVYDDIDSVIVFNEAGSTSQTGTPTPSDPVDIIGIGEEELGGTYSVTINYDDGDGRTGSVIASGLAYPLYEGDVLDFANGKVIRANGYGQMTYSYLSGLSSSNIGYQSNVSQVGGSSVWVRNWNYQTAEAKKSGGIRAFCNSYKISMHDSDIISTQNRTYLGYSGISSVADFLAEVQTLENNGSGLFICYALATPTEENITLTGDISDIGTATVTADGALTVKYDKVEMAIRKYS